MAGEGSSSETEALGRSQGGFSTKIHVRVEGSGKLMTICLTAGQCLDLTEFESLMEQTVVKQ